VIVGLMSWLLYLADAGMLVNLKLRDLFQSIAEPTTSQLPIFGVFVQTWATYP
jgi:hypothetical protein